MAPRTRRQYGTGSITQRGDGRWMGRLDAGYTTTGTRRRITVYGHTEAEAKAKLEKKRKQIAREGVSVATATRASVRTWAERWLATRAATVRPNTFGADKVAVKNWIVPVLGHRKLEALTPTDIRAVTRAQLDAGGKSSSALRTHATLVKLLRDAILEGHDVPQRVLLVEAPSKGSNDRDAMEIQEAVAVLAEAALLPHGSRFAVALLQGMRPAEYLGLTWPRVDFDREVITIDWQLQTLRYNTAYDTTSGFQIPDGYEVRHLVGAWHLVRPKSQAGWRVIPMIPWVRDALLAWRAIAPDSEHDLVWPRDDGRPTSYAADVDEWRGLQGAAALTRWQTDVDAGLRKPRGVGHKAGRYYVPQEARHTTATLLLEAGVDPKIITAILGHSSIVVSRGYQHARTEQAAAALGQIAHQLQLGGTSTGHPTGIEMAP